MKPKNRLYQFLLHYGISAILGVMFVAVIGMLQLIEIDEKAAVDVVREHDGRCYCYVPRSVRLEAGRETLQVALYGGERLRLEIREWEETPAYVVCRVEPQEGASLPIASAGERKLTGYVVTGKVRLWDLLFSKWINKAGK